jgi:hypothetical protein
MVQNKKRNLTEEAKNKSMAQKSLNSLNSKNGYQNTGNDAQVHAKAYAMRQSDNGSHM